MGKKIALVLKNDGNNNYSFKEIKRIFPDENRITINETNYEKLISSQNINFIGENINIKKDIYLVLDEDMIIERLNKDKKINKINREVIKNYLVEVGNNINDIKIDTVDNMLSLNVIFNNEKEYEIDMSEIDPDSIIAEIKEKIVAQDETIETVVRYIHRNQLIIETHDEESIGRKKGNIIIDGPTGTGKTFIMEEVSSCMKLPMIIREATQYTTTGYRGVELQQMLVDLLKEANGNLEAAQRGIIVLDEFDKLGNGKGDGSLEIRKAVQQDLLTYMSGSKHTIEYKGKSYDFDTSKITFVCLGAFTDYREQHQENLDETGNYKMYSEDYINAGIMREMVGRFKVMTSTKKYTREALKRILLESTASPIRDLIETGKVTYNTNIIFEEEIVDEIVEYAYAMNTGARSLQTVIGDIENSILDTLEANRRKGIPCNLTITHEIMLKATAKYREQQEREGKSK